jgi:hypothetical protein
MRKVIYIILVATMFVGIVGFWEIQQLRSEEFREGVIYFIDKILEKDKYSVIGEVYKRNEKRKSNILEIAFAINSYKKDYDCYPDRPEVSGSLTGSGIFSEDFFVNSILPEYLNGVIKDPINSSEHHYTYIYKNDNFVLFARLELVEDNSIERSYYCIDSFSKNPIVVNSNPSLNMKCE